MFSSQRALPDEDSGCNCPPPLSLVSSSPKGVRDNQGLSAAQKSPVGKGPQGDHEKENPVLADREPLAGCPCHPGRAWLGGLCSHKTTTPGTRQLMWPAVTIQTQFYICELSFFPAHNDRIQPKLCRSHFQSMLNVQIVSAHETLQKGCRKCRDRP